MSDMNQPPIPKPCGPVTGAPDMSTSVMSLLASSPIQSTKRNDSAKTPHAANRNFMPSNRGKSASPAPHHQAGGGGERDRTDDLLLAKQALSQLSYTPVPEDRTAATTIAAASAPRSHCNGGPGRI